jgi:hypothetical protein
VFSLPDFSFLGLFDVSLFNQGSVDIAPPELFGHASPEPGEQAVLSAIVFALLSLAIVAVRRGSAGRRLLATKDSEAACATSAAHPRDQGGGLRGVGGHRRHRRGAVLDAGADGEPDGLRVRRRPVGLRADRRRRRGHRRGACSPA